MGTLKKALLLTTAAAGIGLAAPASAVTLVTFGQVGTANTITATNPNSSSTTISGDNVLVDVTQLDSVSPNTPFQAYLDFVANSVGAAASVGLNITQTYSGNFSITSTAAPGGINYLSGVFTDAVFGSGTAFGLTASNATAGEVVTFTSSVIPASELGNPEGISISFTNVAPPLTLTGSGTLAPFTASIAGNTSSTVVTTPEPASLLVLGLGLVGLGFVRHRHSHTL